MLIDDNSLILTDIGYVVDPNLNKTSRFVVFSKQITRTIMREIWFYKKGDDNVELYNCINKDIKYNHYLSELRLDKETLIACLNTCDYLDELTKNSTCFEDTWKIFLKEK